MEVRTYIAHPRLVELKFVLMYDTLSAKMGEKGAFYVLQALADFKSVNIELIEACIRHYTGIKKLKVIDRKRYLQEVYFMANLFGESATEASRKYLKRSVTIFKEDGKLFENFIDKDWLDKLDDEVCILSKSDASKVFDVVICLDYLLGK